MYASPERALERGNKSTDETARAESWHCIHRSPHKHHHFHRPCTTQISHKPAWPLQLHVPLSLDDLQRSSYSGSTRYQFGIAGDTRIFKGARFLRLKALAYWTSKRQALKTALSMRRHASFFINRFAPLATRPTLESFLV